MPAEKIMINFITFNILDDSKAPQKDVSFVEEGRDGSDVLDLGSGKLLQPLEEEAEVKHLGYASHVVELVCDSGDSPRDPVLIQQESLSGTTPTDQTVTMCEEDVQNDTEWEPGDQEGSTQKEASIPETSLEPQANSDPQTFLHSYTPQLRDLQYLAQARRDSEEGPEEEPSITLVDWDPHTGRLYIPSLPSFDQEPESWEHAECAQPMEESLLSRLMEKQAPDDKPLEESKTYLMQFMEEWGLYVQMGN